MSLSIVYFVSCMQCTFPDLEPGVPYNVTVRARTAVENGEPVSIVVFSMQQGKLDNEHVRRIVMCKTCA